MKEIIYVWSVRMFLAGNYSSGERTIYFSIKNDDSLLAINDRIQKYKKEAFKGGTLRIDLKGIEFLGELTEENK